MGKDIWKEKEWQKEVVLIIEELMVLKRPDKDKAKIQNMVQKQVQSIIKKRIEDKGNGNRI
tara:strand:- start:310 stop:492 length:183 start_codon:yes stop_codon:yes gene_type:complete